MRNRGEFVDLPLARYVFISLVFSLVFLTFVSAELDLTLNAKLSDFDTDFYLQTDSDALNGVDSFDFELQSFPDGNYSFLTSTVSGKNLLIDAFPSTNRTIYLVYRVNPSTTGTLDLSWASSALGYHYDISLTDYGSDSSYTTSVASRDMYSSSSYSVSTSGAARYFSMNSSYLSFSCGDGVCNGARRGETCSSCSADCGACSTDGDGDGGGGGGEQPPTCQDSSWTTQSVGVCSYGQKPIVQSSNCGNTRTVYERCCSAGTVYGDWSECGVDNTRRRNVQQTSENCNVVDSVETGTCKYLCRESWSCEWGSCQNGFINPVNCVETNNCGTQDNKPTAISCTQEENVTQILLQGISSEEQSALTLNQNCSINFICDEWSECSVRNGMEDIKNAQGNLDGVKSRKCVDQNGCLLAPYYEQQKCSIKIFIETRKEKVCDRDVLSIYQQGTDYLLARIRDSRETQGVFSMQFVLGGKAPENSCGKRIIQQYNYSLYEDVMSYSNIRKLWGIFQ